MNDPHFYTKKELALDRPRCLGLLLKAQERSIGMPKGMVWECERGHIISDCEIIMESFLPSRLWNLIYYVKDSAGFEGKDKDRLFMIFIDAFNVKPKRIRKIRKCDYSQPEAPLTVKEIWDRLHKLKPTWFKMPQKVNALRVWLAKNIRVAFRGGKGNGRCNLYNWQDVVKHCTNEI